MNGRRVVAGVAGVVLGAGLVMAVAPEAEAGGCRSSVGFSFSTGSYGHRSHFGYGFSYGHRSHRHFGHRGYGHRSHFRSYPRCSYRVGGHGYSYVPAPIYVERPVYVDTCAPFPYYRTARPSTRAQYVYVDPPVRVRTVTSDSAYHEWQGRVREAPVYETVPRVIVEEEDEAEAGRDYAEVVPLVEGDDGEVEGEGVEVVDPWVLLGRGDYASARDAFGVIAEARPGVARARIGYAVGAAALGEESAAASALRGALVVEPEGFLLPTASHGVMPTLDRVSVTLRNLDDDGARTNDRWLVIAALDYLRGEHGLARDAIKRARALGEEHLGAKNLWRLLGLSDKPLEKVRISD